MKPAGPLARVIPILIGLTVIGTLFFGVCWFLDVVLYQQTTWLDLHSGQEKVEHRILGHTLRERVTQTSFSKRAFKLGLATSPPDWYSAANYHWPSRSGGHTSPILQKIFEIRAIESSMEEHKTPEAQRELITRILFRRLTGNTFILIEWEESDLTKIIRIEGQTVDEWVATPPAVSP